MNHWLPLIPTLIKASMNGRLPIKHLFLLLKTRLWEMTKKNRRSAIPEPAF